MLGQSMSVEKRKVNWKQNLFFVWLSQLLSMAGFAAVMPFIPVYLRVKFGIEDPNIRGGYVAIFNFATITFANGFAIKGTLRTFSDTFIAKFFVNNYSNKGEAGGKFVF